MKLSFNVEGEFITQMARDWFYLERRPFEKVKELLLSCMCGTNIQKEILDQYVEDILKFKRKFVGQTKNNTFCLIEDNEQNAIVKNYNSIKKYGKIPFEICEYGFIKPNGEYIPVQWCQHLKYANEYIQSNYSIEDQMTIYYKYKNAEDYLIKELCWILIENPHQEMGIIHTGNFITKAQKETLFDYYIFFDRNNEAIELYK